MRFDHLLPEIIFDTVAAQGYLPTGVLVPLNSYENRVYEIGIEEGEPLVAKYYRPGRWDFETIAEEHRFVATLAEAEVPVVRHLELKKHLKGLSTLNKTADGIFYAIFPKFRGREHAEVTDDDRRWLGRTLARLHNVGEGFSAKHRMRLTAETYGHHSLSFILTQEFLPPDLKQSIETHLAKAIELVEPYFAKPMKTIPLHGDCHPGNILWRSSLDGGHRGESRIAPRSQPASGFAGAGDIDGPHLLDFDDMVMAPAIQDVWMLLNGTDEDKRGQMRVFLEGYEVFREFDESTLILSEPLRTLRMIRHAAWIGQRYEEPAFQRAFPYYRERRHWEEFLQGIKEQIGLLQELSWA